MKKRGFLIDQYSRCWKFFKESRWHIVFALGIFCLTFIVGFAYPQFFRAEIFSFIEELMAMLEGKGMFELMGIIVFNNMNPVRNWLIIKNSEIFNGEDI